MKRLQRIRLLVMGLVTAMVATACLVGPLPEPEDIALSTGFAVTEVGYERSEFLVVQAAQSYSSAAPLTTDGKWTVTPDPDTEQFRTRLVVHRPSDPADFNGTVIVEWMNVTSGSDLANEWIMAHNQYVREGSAWIGVSAQAVGVNQLRTANPDRYGNLMHPGDSYSYDMFTKIGEDILEDPDVLGGLPVERMIASGESQSASRLVTYINAVHPIADVYDGFLVHSRGSSGSSLRQAPLGQISPPSGTLIRDDLNVPVMVVQAEDDVIRSNLSVRQPDSPIFRMWEMAGTAHADTYLIIVGRSDTDGSGTATMFERMQVPFVAGCDRPVNAGAHWLFLQAAYDSLDAWIDDGVAPPMAPLLATDGNGELSRDQHGIAIGGIRSPHVDVPIATLDGINDGPSFCRLFGSTTPFTEAELDALYPTHQDFVDAWTAATHDAVDAGFILPEDAPALIAAAADSNVGG